MTRTDRRALLYIGGVALGWVVAAKFLFKSDPPAPPMPASPNGVAWSPRFSPVELKNSTAYRGCVSVPWPFSPSVDTVVAKAEATGFRLVRVDETRPADWPDVDCKQYVEATWSKPDQSFDVPSVIKHVWQLG